MSAEPHAGGRQPASPPDAAPVDPYDADCVLRMHRPTSTTAYTVGGGPGRIVTTEHAHPICAKCRQPWRGDRDTGGCPAVMGAREVLGLRAALVEMERVACALVRIVRDEWGEPDSLKHIALASMCTDDEVRALAAWEVRPAPATGEGG